MRSDIAHAVALVEGFRKANALPEGYAYAHISEDQLFSVEVVPIEEVAPFPRGAGVPGLLPERANAILRDISHGVLLHPVNVYQNAIGSAGPKFQLYHGYHRYYISVAIGFTHIPVAINLDQNHEL
jgi:hypothetical protein